MDAVPFEADSVSRLFLFPVDIGTDEASLLAECPFKPNFDALMNDRDRKELSLFIHLLQNKQKAVSKPETRKASSSSSLTPPPPLKKQKTDKIHNSYC